MVEQTNTVPMLVVTGFLGSGKTTLLNELLDTRHESGFDNVAIIVNEFGDVGLDADLLGDGNVAQVEIPGGCICCIQSETLAETLQEVLGRSPQPDCIVLETTGVAEPLPIGWMLEEAPLAGAISLRAMVTVLDPVQLPTMLTQSPVCESQLREASIVVPSHLDTEEGQDAWQSRLPFVRELNHEAIVVDTLPRPLKLWKLFAGAEIWKARGSDTNDAHRDVDTISLEVKADIDVEELVDGLAQLPDNFWRVKAIVHGQEATRGDVRRGWFAAHKVGSRASWEQLNGHFKAKIVALGQDLQVDLLEELIGEAALAEK